MNTNHQYRELLLNLQALNAQASKCHGKAGALGLKKTTLWLNDIIFENCRKMNLLKTHIESNTVAVELEALDISAKIAASWEKMTPAGRDEVMKALGLSLFSAKGEPIGGAVAQQLKPPTEEKPELVGCAYCGFNMPEGEVCDSAPAAECEKAVAQQLKPTTNEGEQQ